MSLKSDGWIIGQCRQPTHMFHPIVGKPYLVGPPYTQYQNQLINALLAGHQQRAKHVAVPLTKAEREAWEPMIDNFCPDPVRYVTIADGKPYKLKADEEVPEGVRKVISFGVSSYGYDVRLQADPDQIKVFTNVFVPEIDPKRMVPEAFAAPAIRIDVDGAKYVLIPAHSYIQAPTMEYFRIPRDVLVMVLGKSTYARSALICNVTPIEPEFEGEVVIEVANVTNSPVRCYLEEGISQFVFFQGDEACLKSYKDKLGKYMHQRGLTLAKV